MMTLSDGRWQLRTPFEFSFWLYVRTSSKDGNFMRSRICYQYATLSGVWLHISENMNLINVTNAFCLHSSASDCIYSGDDFLDFDDKVDKRLNEIKNFLCQTFKTKDIGWAKHCIGVRIWQQNCAIELDQAGYIREILDRFGMSNCKPNRDVKRYQPKAVGVDGK